MNTKQDIRSPRKPNEEGLHPLEKAVPWVGAQELQPDGPSARKPRSKDEKIDDIVDQSFPASDPPGNDGHV